MEWQPIETFWNESDKTKPILVYFPSYGVQQVRMEFTGVDVFKFDGRATLAKRYDWMDLSKSPSIPPTHWMPLPEPPK